MDSNFIVDYFCFAYDGATVMEILALAFALPLVLDAPKKWTEIKEILFFILRIVLLFAGLTFVSCLVFGLAKAVPFFAGINFPLGYLVSFIIYSLAFSKHPNNSQKIILTSVLYANAMLIDEFAMRCMDAMNTTVNLLWGRIPAILLTVAVAILIHHFSLDKFKTIPLGATIAIFADAVFSAFFVFFAIANHLHPLAFFYTATEIAALLILYLMTIVGYLLVYAISKERKDALIFEAKTRMGQSNMEMLKLTRSNIEEIRKIRHDIRNQVALMKSYLDSGNLDGLRDYFDSFQANVLPSLSTFDCNNEAIKTIITLERRKAKNHDVALSCRAIVPDKLPFDDYDLCSLLTNIVDNAIECLDRERAEDRTINLNIVYGTDKLFLQCKNPVKQDFRKDELQHLKTTKNDSLVHGLGCRIIQGICQKYHGFATFQKEEGLFVVRAYLMDRELVDEED